VPSRSRRARCQSDWFAGAFTEGCELILRSGCTLSTLATGRNDPSTSSRSTTFDLAGRRASLGLTAYLGHGVKMPRLRFYNQRSRHEHSISTPPPETAYQASWVTPPTSSSGSGRRMPYGAPQPQTFARQIEHRGGEALPPFRPWLDAGPPRGHPASSGCVLDGTPAGFGPIDCRMDARGNERPDAVRVSRTRAPALFRLTGPLSTEPSGALLAGGRSWRRRAAALPVT
jgi:hypothetical protein